MIAYNEKDLDNLHIRDQVEKAIAENCMSKEESAQVSAVHPVAFYTPNIYIRIGLFILTVVIVTFSFGLLTLIVFSSGSSDGAIQALLIIAGLACFGVLETMIAKKRHFQSGVDDALLWMGAALLLSGIYWSSGRISPLSLSLIVFSIALICTLRYIDRLMALVAFGALLAVVFYFVLESLGTTGKIIAPFLLMAVSITLYFFCSSLLKKEGVRHYHSSLVLIRAATLVSFYLAGNYFVVREMTIQLFDLPSPAFHLPMGWLFWILTLTTPLFYIYRGLQKKDTTFLWVGLALVAATICTVRHYYAILPIEGAMTIGGIILIAIAYAAIQYLKIPRHGFTYKEQTGKHVIELLHIESIVISEIAAPPGGPSSEGIKFGGGSGGGGGAGGQF